MSDKFNNILENIDKAITTQFEIIEKKDINFGIQYKFKYNFESQVLRIFFNKKNEIKIDYSTVSNAVLKNKLEALLQISGEAIKSNYKGESNPIQSNDYLKIQPSIGTDESGKGDYFGPLVTSSVFVDNKTRQILDRFGIQDSKKLSDSRIIELAQIIKKYCFKKYVVIEVAPTTYNKLYTQFKNEGKNLNVLLAWSHAKAIEELLANVECEIAISDQFADEKFIVSKLQEKGRMIKLIQEHKAERYTSVAAASILARERFLDRLKKISLEYSMDFAKGASNIVVEQARDFVKKYGKQQLVNVAKMHFKTTEQVI